MKTNDNYVLLILFNGHWGWRVRRPPSSSSTNHLTEETAVEVPPSFKGIFSSNGRMAHRKTGHFLAGFGQAILAV
jgi:hypothetical protein